MVAERWAQPAWAPPDADALVLAECATVLDRLYERIAHRFGRVEVRARVRHTPSPLTGLCAGLCATRACPAPRT
jgi:hypothetical protein